MGRDLWFGVFSSRKHVEQFELERGSIDGWKVWDETMKCVDHSVNAHIGFRDGILSEIYGSHKVTEPELTAWIKKIIGRLELSQADKFNPDRRDDCINSISTLTYILREAFCDYIVLDNERVVYFVLE